MPCQRTSTNNVIPSAKTNTEYDDSHGKSHNHSHHGNNSHMRLMEQKHCQHKLRIGKHWLCRGCAFWVVDAIVQGLCAGVVRMAVSGSCASGTLGRTSSRSRPHTRLLVPARGLVRALHGRAPKHTHGTSARRARPRPGACVSLVVLTIGSLGLPEAWCGRFRGTLLETLRVAVPELRGEGVAGVAR